MLSSLLQWFPSDWSCELGHFLVFFKKNACGPTSHCFCLYHKRTAIIDAHEIHFEKKRSCCLLVSLHVPEPKNAKFAKTAYNFCFSCHNFWQFRNLTYHVNVEKDESRRKERNNQIKGQKEQKHSWHFFRNRELQKWWKLQWHDNRRVDEHPQFLRGPTKNVSRNSGKNVAIKPHIYWPAIRPLKVKEGIYFWIQFPLSLKLEWGFWKTNWSTRRNFCVNSNLLFWN